MGSSGINAVQDVDEFEVEKIIDKKVDNGKTLFLVKWKGWEDPQDFTWEPKSNLKGSEKLIKEFEKTLTSKKKDPVSPKGKVSSKKREEKSLESEKLDSSEHTIEDVDEFEVEKIND